MSPDMYPLVFQDSGFLLLYHKHVVLLHPLGLSHFSFVFIYKACIT